MEFEQFVRDRSPALVRFASALCADHPGLGEDVVQEVLLRLHRRWATVSQLDAVDAYARRAIVNEYLSWRRKWARVIPYNVLPRPRSVPPEPIEQLADRSQMAEHLAGLPPRQRAVLVLRFYEGLSDGEIAALLGCRSVTVRGYASRALAALRVDLVDQRFTTPRSDHVF